MSAFSGDILKGNTLTLILSLIEEQPMYGVQIAKEVGRRSEGAFQFGESLLYPALHHLEKEELVGSEWRSSSQGPGRKYYRLTRKGKREAARLRRRWWAFSDAVGQVLGGRSGD